MLQKRAKNMKGVEVMCKEMEKMRNEVREEAREEAMHEMIYKMLKKNYSNAEIKEFYDVSDELIEKIKAEVYDD